MTTRDRSAATSNSNNGNRCIEDLPAMFLLTIFFSLFDFYSLSVLHNSPVSLFLFVMDLCVYIFGTFFLLACPFMRHQSLVPSCADPPGPPRSLVGFGSNMLVNCSLAVQSRASELLPADGEGLCGRHCGKPQWPTLPLLPLRVGHP